jgi:ribosomal protein S27E
VIQEITQSHYLGVLCSRCEERIPVPRRAAVLYEELKRGEVSDGQEVKSRAFTLRCKACNEEGVYEIKEMQEFEGTPRARTSKTQQADVTAW